MSTFSRRRKPPDGKRHGWYKDCLRLDFQFRCAYCLIHEADNQGPENFQVDHFRPKSKREFKSLEKVYSNLYYACYLCNKPGRKSDNWPSSEEGAKGERFVDPCVEDWEEHLEFLEDGSVRPLTPAGAFSLRTIGLDREQVRRHREKFPHEYFTRSALAAAKRRLRELSAVVSGRTDLAPEVRPEVKALQQQLPRLEARIVAAWRSKEAFPPEPRCPY